MHLLNAQNLKELNKIDMKTCVYTNVYSPDNNLFFIGGRKEKEQSSFINLKDGSIIHQYDFMVSHSALSDNKEWICGRIASGDDRDMACIIHIPTKKCTVHRFQNDAWAKDCGFIPDKEQCYIGCNDGSVFIVDCKTPKKEIRL